MFDNHFAQFLIDFEPDLDEVTLIANCVLGSPGPYLACFAQFLIDLEPDLDDVTLIANFVLGSPGPYLACPSQLYHINNISFSYCSQLFFIHSQPGVDMLTIVRPIPLYRYRYMFFF